MMVVRSWSNQSPYDDLPCYLTEPPAAPRRNLRQRGDDLAKLLKRSAAPPPLTPGPSVPFGGHTPGLSPVFTRMVPLQRRLLSGALDAWWEAGAKRGAVTVHHRLQLKLPEGDAAGGWRMRGRVRRLTTLHWIPVVVELWPMYDEFTMMTMAPQGHVFATKRYFRLGHSVLDRLWADLVTMTKNSN